jgi:hypothetical protein
VDGLNGTFSRFDNAVFTQTGYLLHTRFLAEVPLSLMLLRRGLDDALVAGFTASRALFPAANINLIATKNRPPPA